MVDFGLTAKDYSKHRKGFPDSIFNRLRNFDIGLPNQKVLDLGTGTGMLARGFALRECNVVGIDPSESMLIEARKIDSELGVNIDYRVAVAEETGLEENIFDVVVAGQCWHWFDGEKAAKEVHRILIPKGKVVIAHFDWIPLGGNIVEDTEALILSYNASWHMDGGTGLYPKWLVDLGNNGFEDIQTFSYDLDVPYTPEDWRGRIRASAGVGASLNEKKVEEFDLELKNLLEEKFPGNLIQIPHRVWVVVATNGDYLH